MSDSSENAQAILNDYPRLIVANYCIVATSAMLWFDFALTFPTECRRIWGRKFSGATVIYLFTRYGAMAQRILQVAVVLTWYSSDQVSLVLPLTYCGALTHTDDVLSFLNYTSIASFTALRVYAVWGRDWRPLVVVLPLALVRPALLLYEYTQYTPIQAGPPFGFVSYGIKFYFYATFTDSPVSISERAASIGSDTILIILTWYKTFGIKRISMKTGVRTPLATLLLRDGTGYFLVLLVIQLISIITSQVGHHTTIWVVWPYFDQIFSVIFLSRFMLNLRGLYFANNGADREPGAQSTLPAHWSDIKFQELSARVVGNLGATLDTTGVLPGESSTSMTTTTTDSEVGAQEWAYYDEWEDADDVPELVLDPFKAGMNDDGEVVKSSPLETVETCETDKVSVDGDSTGMISPESLRNPVSVDLVQLSCTTTRADLKQRGPRKYRDPIFSPKSTVNDALRSGYRSKLVAGFSKVASGI
ncbi:hypothetical protein C8Q78DRAFT_977408 [Trametes maxima]|nr:hypothetical protein C8Q78DRAFT_977408 [Trametes maxima]